MRINLKEYINHWNKVGLTGSNSGEPLFVPMKTNKNGIPKDREFQTYQGWLQATRKLAGFIQIHGDKDIAHAEFVVNADPVRIYAEWDGVVGRIEYFEKI